MFIVILLVHVFSYLCHSLLMYTAARSEDPSDKDISSSDGVTIHTTFESMALKEDLLRGIYAYGELIIC